MKMEQKKVTINEVEYTLQKLPVRHALKMQQRFSDSSLPDGINTEIACDECFANIVVSPKITLDEFDYIEDAVELMAECIVFQFAGKQKKESSNKK